MRVPRKLQATVGAAVVAGAILAPATPASAWAGDHFKVCVGHEACYYSYTEGDIDWYSRTAYVSGLVTDSGYRDYATATFEAYAGDVKVVSTTRSANDDPGSSLGSPNYFSFTIGDPNRVGGFDRLKITICEMPAEPGLCTTFNETRD